jgi:hypothetical protein
MLMEQSLGAMLKTAFSVYGLFWVVMIVGLFIFVGRLMKKEEELVEKQKHHYTGRDLPRARRPGRSCFSRAPRARRTGNARAEAPPGRDP